METAINKHHSGNPNSPSCWVHQIKVSPPVDKKLPSGSLGFPFIGETISFLRAQRQDKTVEWIESRIAKYGPVFKTSLMGSKPMSVAKILGKHSIFELAGTRHKLVRGAIMNFLKPESIQRSVSRMDSVVQQQLFQGAGREGFSTDGWVDEEDNVQGDLQPTFWITRWERDRRTFGGFYHCPQRSLDSSLGSTGTVFRKALQARGRICKQLAQLVRERKAKIEEGRVDSHEDIISSLITLRQENGQPLSEEEIIDNLISVVIASHDTSTVLLGLLIRHLARDTEVCKKVLEEQKQVAKAKEGKGNGKLTWGEVQMMKYTWRVAQELMRMTPPVLGNFKCAWRDTTFGGFDIPKGWQVFWVAPGTHMDKKVFEEPEKFDPSRFENPSTSVPPYAYLAFGAGPRACPGADFSRVEVLLMIHNLITKYHWAEMIIDEPIVREPMPYPAMGLPVKLYQRSTT
ncbi:Taxadiene 5-alpha hydroxylase [Vitis vinifera]|uniref:Taxadiene 5-alpha hydroxylase n=1 Tax=Vitis vinifera TaxID=29760 RepID=A0A438E3V2_VITVI|nr:Taxadiene 5-alpha hydroxylase [Vitis vinifera]